ncbi:MAG: hypothetical protein LC808_25890 [Actinobacteria bacterium]|nr:hypothetical protein [Actinomycetota bacterium]
MRKFIAALSVAGVMLAGMASPALAHKGEPAQNAKAERACEKEGGLFIDLGGIAYACVLPTMASDKDIRKAQALCGRQGGLFASVGNVVYACVLPGTELPVGGLPIPGTGGLLGSGDGGLRILPVLVGGGVLIGPGVV